MSLSDIINIKELALIPSIVGQSNVIHLMLPIQTTRSDTSANIGLYLLSVIDLDERKKNLPTKEKIHCYLRKYLLLII